MIPTGVLLLVERFDLYLVYNIFFQTHLLGLLYIMFQRCGITGESVLN